MNWLGYYCYHFHHIPFILWGDFYILACTRYLYWFDKNINPTFRAWRCEKAIWFALQKHGLFFFSKQLFYFRKNVTSIGFVYRPSDATKHKFKIKDNITIQNKIWISIHVWNRLCDEIPNFPFFFFLFCIALVNFQSWSIDVQQ